MATGRNIRLTHQIGKHLVAAKLGRLGYIEGPLAGNVPGIDLLIADEKGHSMPVQVRAINGGSWQFQISKFLDVEIIDDVQYVKRVRKLANLNLVCILVLLSADEKDDFFILHLRDLQKYFSAIYKGGRRSKNPQSLHCAVVPKDLEQFRDNWSLIERDFDSA